MNTHDTCRFCGIVAGKYQYLGIDEPFASDENFLAMASIGALVEGWSLVIPRSHHFSMKTIYKGVKLANFVNALLPKLSRRYGSVVAFEHGANNKESITACGTAHAHLHLVPLEDTLLPAMHKTDMTWLRCHTSEIEEISQRKEYLFYCDLVGDAGWSDPLGYIHVLDSPTPQYFRRLIANRKGQNEAFDYRHFPHLDVARRTRARLISSIA